MVMSEPDDLREFVGFIWRGDDFGEQTGVLIMATDSTVAASELRAAYGEGVGVSIWNEEDASRPR